jgi:osomolarity two-component system response regulator SSK1
MGTATPMMSQRKSVSNETIVEGREEEYQTSLQRRMKSVSSVPSNRPNTPGTLHKRSQSNPAEHASAVLLMPSNSKTKRSHSTTQTTRLQSESPERIMSPTNKDEDQYINNSSMVQLPRIKSPSSRITNGTSTMAKVLPSVNVLIVEDNLINLRILSAHLRRHRIHYDVAKNGQEAIDKWRKGGFHLVLMDIQLPVMSGLDASKEIRRLEKLNHIGVFSALDLQNLPPKKPEEELDVTVFRSPVIIVALTASNLIQDKQQALAAGCNDYLTKPVNLDWLLNKLTEWGCMQALIDFDGWKSGERMTNISAALPSLTRNASTRRAPVSESAGKY